jgi:hypothetical protein
VTFTIPEWLLWAVGLLIGVPLVVVILFFAVVGFLMASSFSRR